MQHENNQRVQGQTLLASLPPTAGTNQPQNQAPQPFPMQLEGAFRREQNALRDVTELRDRKAGEKVATCFLSLRHTEAQPWSAQVPDAPASCILLR